MLLSIVTSPKTLALPNGWKMWVEIHSLRGIRGDLKLVVASKKIETFLN